MLFIGLIEFTLSLFLIHKGEKSTLTFSTNFAIYLLQFKVLILTLTSLSFSLMSFKFSNLFSFKGKLKEAATSLASP